ncbi:MAG: hypothetical protein IPP83_09690 [Flavobacteriales bacterium]|nr:hypothetical protein [Flavobacteriales bacterium]
MRLLLLASFFLFTFTSNAQRIENASRSTTGYINPDGRIENSSRSTVGYINKDGSLRDIASASDNLSISALSTPVEKWYLAWPRWLGKM